MPTELCRDENEILLKISRGDLKLFTTVTEEFASRMKALELHIPPVEKPAEKKSTATATKTEAA